jgi:putative Mg2+ transporter-C (MgtC) family protein
MAHLLDLIKEDQLLKVGIALLMGALLGFEREYKRKTAGMRTITLICVSSTLFTILSAELGYPSSPDRVASNILTGVGFIGAGVIFKGSFTIDGITTAATIWIAAALGMAIGMSQFLLACFSLAGSLFTLTVLEYAEAYVPLLNDRRFYSVKYDPDKAPGIDMQNLFITHNLKFLRESTTRKDGLIQEKYAARGKRKNLNLLDAHLYSNKDIQELEIQSNPQ